jgi:hypothetical protein
MVEKPGAVNAGGASTFAASLVPGRYDRGLEIVEEGSVGYLHNSQDCSHWNGTHRKDPSWPAKRVKC